MKKDKLIILFGVLTLVIVIIGIILFGKNRELRSKQIQIIDASYMCAQSREKFYEDDQYTYSFPCIKSSSVFVKFPDGKKVLVVKALEEEMVTIDELIKAGLEVIKVSK